MSPTPQAAARQSATWPPVAVIAWHGTRGAAGRADTARLTAALAQSLASDAADVPDAAGNTDAGVANGTPAPRVVAAFVDAEVQRPALAEVLAAELADPSAQVVVVPALLAAGFHVRTDIPTVVAACPDPARVHVTAHLGGGDGRVPTELVSAIGAAIDTVPHLGTGRCVLVSAGSSVAAVEDELALLAAAVSDRIGGPCAHEVLAAARSDVTKQDAVVPLLLAEGHFAEQMRRLPGRCGALLGAEPAAAHVVALLRRRYREGVAAVAARTGDGQTGPGGAAGL